MISERVYNTQLPWAPACSSADYVYGLEEMLDVYSPFGQIRNVLCCFRSGVGIGGYQGSAVPFSLDHVYRRILGMSSLTVGLDRQIYGGGKGLSLADTVAASLGEAVERMLGAFSSFSHTDKAVTATAAEMANRGLRFVGPDQIQFFTSEQLSTTGFICVPWTDQSRVNWVKGVNLSDDEDFWVPAQFVHLVYMPDTREEDRVGASSSGGLANHYTAKRALYHAMLENVERDALNLTWFCKIPLTRIVIDEKFHDSEIERWLQTAERSGMKIDFYLHRMDMPEFYVVTASSVNPDLDAHAYVSGGGVGVDIETAIRSALAEVVQAERMVRSPTVSPQWELTRGFKRRFTVKQDASMDDFTNFIQVVDYYGFKENQHKLDWFLRDPDMPTITLSQCHNEWTGGDKYQRVLDLYKKYSLTPIVFDFTPSGFKQICIKKVFVPELAPAFPPNVPLLGHKRYRILRMQLGMDDHEWALADMPTDPLPYP